MTDTASIQALLAPLIELTWQASSKIIEIYNDTFDVVLKGDGSPLTEADLASHRILNAGIAPIDPDIRVVSEEDSTQIPAEELRGRRFWLIDPLDGTKEFVKRTGEFTVNIALIDGARPQLGIVAAPALGILYAGIVGGGAFRIEREGSWQQISIDSDDSEGVIVVGSRSHGDPARMEAFLEGRHVRDFIAVGSSLKFCRLAEGAAHLYPRFGRTMEWDTAAGHAVLLAAGGTVETLDRTPLLYGKDGLDNPHFLARTCPV